MMFNHLYRTTDMRMQAIRVQVVSDLHVQDLKLHHVCIKVGDLVRADSVYVDTSPKPQRWLGDVFEDVDQQRVFRGKAVVYCFETEAQMLAFCERSLAIEATLYESDERASPT